MYPGTVDSVWRLRGRVRLRAVSPSTGNLNHCSDGYFSFHKMAVLPINITFRLFHTQKSVSYFTDLVPVTKTPKYCSTQINSNFLFGRMLSNGQRSSYLKPLRSSFKISPYVCSYLFNNGSGKITGAVCQLAVITPL